MSCDNCPIKNTEYCHLVNPKAKKLTRTEKEELAERMKGRTDNGMPDISTAPTPKFKYPLP